MSTCMRCGKEIADGSSFCNDCKTVVNPVENVQPTYVQQYQQANPVQSTPVQPTPVQPNPAQQQYAPPPQQPNMNYQQQPNMNYQQPYQQQQPNMNYQQPYQQQQPNMNYQQPYMGYPQPEQPKKAYGALICGIIGIVFSFLFALVGHAASITGIVLGAKEKKTQGSSAGLIVSIIGEVLSVISSLIGLVSMLSLFL